MPGETGMIRVSSAVIGTRSLYPYIYFRNFRQRALTGDE